MRAFLDAARASRRTRMSVEASRTSAKANVRRGRGVGRCPRGRDGCFRDTFRDKNLHETEKPLSLSMTAFLDRMDQVFFVGILTNTLSFSVSLRLSLSRGVIYTTHDTLKQASTFIRGETTLKAGSSVKSSSSSRRHASVSVRAAGVMTSDAGLHNLSRCRAQRRKPTRKGRGYGAGQGGTCGYGMRGQARGGTGTRPGFEGGQTPMYRRFPKLKGIAGGMVAGKPKFVTVNVSDLAQALADSKISAGQDVDLDTLKSVGLIKATGYYRNLPLKVLGDGELTQGLKVKAAAFSASASEKLAAAGGEAILVEGRETKVESGSSRSRTSCC